MSHSAQLDSIFTRIVTRFPDAVVLYVDRCRDDFGFTLYDIETSEGDSLAICFPMLLEAIRDDIEEDLSYLDWNEIKADDGGFGQIEIKNRKRW